MNMQAARYGQLAVVKELRAIGFVSADKLQHTDKLGFTPRFDVHTHTHKHTHLQDTEYIYK